MSNLTPLEQRLVTLYEQQIARLESRLAAAEKRITELETTASAASGSPRSAPDSQASATESPPLSLEEVAQGLLTLSATCEQQYEELNASVESYASQVAEQSEQLALCLAGLERLSEILPTRS